MANSVRTAVGPPPLASLSQQWEQLERSSRSPVLVRDGERRLRAWGPPERPFVVGVEPDGGRWQVEGWGCTPAQARRAVREMFSLDNPLEQFYRRTRSEPLLQGTESRFRGLRLPRDASPYEALLHSIIGQQLSVASANALKQRLLERYGQVVEAGRIEVPVVPSPRTLVAAGATGLRSLGLSRAKSAALVGVAFEEPRARSARWLCRVPLETARLHLEQLRGVGRWTAENALLRGAGRRDVFVAGDLGVRVALERFGGLSRSAPEERAREWAERHYPGWGSYATLYLWRKLVAENASDEAG